jgi:hypothetical protein
LDVVEPRAHPRLPRRCDRCFDDSDFVFDVTVDARTSDGRQLRRTRICELCLAAEGFTGWSYGSGGWPLRDLLGHAHPPEADETMPPPWREIGAALEGRVPAVPG